MELARGQKIKLSAIVGQAARFHVGIRAEIAGHPLTVCALALDAHERVADPRHLVSTEGARTPCGGLVRVEAIPGDAATFEIDLERLAGTIARVVFTLSCEDGASMGQLQKGRLGVMQERRVVAQFPLEGKDFGHEKSMMLVEVYKLAEWRLAAVAQGFAGGLRALLDHYGVPKAVPLPTPMVAPPPPAPKVVAPRPDRAPLGTHLGTVSFARRGDSQGLFLLRSVSGKGTSRFDVDLTWETVSRPPGTPPLEPTDLQLGCLYRLAEGPPGCVQALGGLFGKQRELPHITLETVASPAGATSKRVLHLYRPDLVDQVVIYVMFEGGTTGFTDISARVTLKDDAGTEFQMGFEHPDPDLPFCAVALLERRHGGIEVTKEERYFVGHRGCDAHYAFGFKWSSGVDAGEIS